MKTVKFTTTDANQKQFGTEVRKNVNAYFKENGISTKGNTTMFTKTVVIMAMYIIPFVVILTVPMGIWPALLLVILMGVGEAGLGMSVMHDAAHGAFSSKRWVNSLFASTMYLMGSNTLNWKIQHNILHHTFTNIYEFDQDIDTKAVIRLSKHAPIKRYHRFQYIYAFFFYGLMTIFRLLTDVFQLLKYHKAGITKEQQVKISTEIIKLMATKVIYLFATIGLPLLLTNFSVGQVILGFVVLQLTAGIIMSVVFQMAHVVEGLEQPLPNNTGTIENDWMVHELNTTANFAQNNRLLSWYVGGLNFQIEHHFFPNTCHVHYPKIAPIVQKTAQEFGYTYLVMPTLWDAFMSHVKSLKALGKK
jgi:linoleoyl-CoA desaturase